MTDSRVGDTDCRKGDLVMCRDNIGTRPQNSEAIYDQLQQVPLNAVRNVMTDQLIEQSCQGKRGQSPI